MTSPLSRRDLARAALLAVVTAGIWLVANSLWQANAWLAPPEYDVDALETLARIKLIGEQGLAFFADKTMPRLGAPFGADWSSYPMPDAAIFLALGKLAKVTGLVATGHFAILFAHLVNVLVFYFCSRTLGHRPPFAAGAALLFGFSHYNISRGLSHYSFTLSFVVPASLLVAWLVGSSRQLLQRRRWQLFCLATAAIAAAGNPYYGLMFAMLLVMAAGFQAWTCRRRPNLLVGTGCLAVWCLVTTALNYSAIEGLFVSGRRVLVRNYANMELYGLRPIEWIVPPPYHRFPGAAQFTQAYGRSTLFEGEHFSSYLGVIGVVGVAMVMTGFLRALLRRQAGVRPAHASIICFIVAFGMVGGLNSAVALTVTMVFRASNRYAVFILAASLYALAAWASVRWRRLHRSAAYAIAAALVGFGLWDSMRPIPTAEQLAARAKAPEVDQLLARELEHLLPPGAMVFQLPAVPFLEQPAILGMGDYEHFRPFLFTSALRFSYGLLANEDAMVWQRRVARLPAAEMKTELEAAGFWAVDVCRSAYVDGAAVVRRNFEAVGAPVIFDSGPHLVARLRPAGSPQRPVLTGPNRYEPWDGVASATGKLAVLEGTGWFESEARGTSQWRWAGRVATCVLWNPTGAARSVRVHCSVMGMAKNQLAIGVDRGRELWRGQLDRVGIPCEFQMELDPGETLLQWSYDGTPIRPSYSDKRMLCFRVNDLAVDER